MLYSNYGISVTNISSSVGFPNDNQQWTTESVQNAVLNSNYSSYFVPFTNITYSQISGGGADADVSITFEFPLQIIKPSDNIYSYWEVTTVEMIFDFLPNKSESASTKKFSNFIYRTVLTN